MIALVLNKPPPGGKSVVFVETSDEPFWYDISSKNPEVVRQAVLRLRDNGKKIFEVPIELAITEEMGSFKVYA